MENKKEVYDAIHHYWGSKGYIRNHQLFDYLDIFLTGNDPFQIEKCLKLFAKEVLIVQKVLTWLNPSGKNTFINGYTIKKEIFDKIYESEFNRLTNLIGKSERRSCDCGIKSIHTIVLFNNNESEIALSVFWNYNTLRKGNLYWKGHCKECGFTYSEIEWDHGVKNKIKNKKVMKKMKKLNLKNRDLINLSGDGILLRWKYSTETIDVLVNNEIEAVATWKGSLYLLKEKLNA